MDKTRALRRYLLTVALGFGLGGLIWGTVLYRCIPYAEYPFHYSSAIFISLFGGISLMWFGRKIKEIVKSVLSLLLGIVVGFFSMVMFMYPLYLYGSLFLLPLGYLVEIEKINKFINLEPSISVGDFWAMFLIIGLIAGLSYSLFFKLKKWPVIWRGGVGFALGSLIAPVIGNSFGFLFDCQLISYLLTFSLMSAIFGLFLGWGVRVSER